MSTPLQAPSEDFEQAFSDHVAGCRRTCACGRECFDVENDYDWEEGELEGLKKLADERPRQAVALPYGCETMTINGREYVIGCPCNQARNYEDFIIAHARQLADYLNRRAKMLRAQAGQMEVTGGES